MLPLKGEDISRLYVLFAVERQRYALPLVNVIRALRMVALTPAPEMPDWVAGMINMAGETIVAVDFRGLFNKRKKDLELKDRLLIVKIGNETVAVIVDEVLGVLEFAADRIEPPPEALSASRALAAVVRLDGILVMVLDTFRLLPQHGAHTDGERL